MVAKMHRMHIAKVGEGVIYLPGGVPFEADDDPRYLAGAYMRLGNKEFIYAIAGGTLNTDMGAMNSLRQKVVESGCTIEVAAGALVVGITIAGAVGGILKDELAGGQFVAFPGDSNSFVRGIVSNTLVEAGGGTLYVTLDSPTPVVIPITKWCDCMANPYSAVKENQGVWAMVMGMPTVKATVGQGLWLQVSGPCWAAPVYGATGPGGAGRVLDCIFKDTGSIAVRHESGDANRDCQHAGVVIATLTVAGQGSPFIMLQIAH